MPTKPSTSVAKAESLLPAGVSQEEYDALLGQQDDELDDGFVQLPIIKIGQKLTKEVDSGEAEEGDFIDSLVGESLGTAIGFIVSYFQKGRFASDKESNRAFVAFGDLIPANWADLVGEEWVGTRFDEHPDAEEQFKAKVNAGEMKWGSGPKISTTWNFTGLAILPGLDEGDDDELRPARISLQRAAVPAANTWLRYKKSKLRRGAFWDATFDLTTEKKEFTRGKAFLPVVKFGRPTTSDERQLAFELAQAVAQNRVRDNSDTAADPEASAPSANEGALGV